jgi:hypothetical protein
MPAIARQAIACMARINATQALYDLNPKAGSGRDI